MCDWVCVYMVADLKLCIGLRRRRYLYLWKECIKKNESK
jgi:hypothetical protein